jgi:glycosyltransferase involved in cell wall biosynthesis
MKVPPPELLVVMPVFNEQASVRKVVTEWFQEIGGWLENFVFLAIDDGSEDGTMKILQRLQEQLGPNLEILSRENRGHGQSCLQGYRIACDRQIPYVFQIDSDGQCDPQYFFRFWRKREQYDVIYGKRVRRDDGGQRILASFVLKLALLFACRTYCPDANVPYRLMRTAVLPPLLEKIPPSFFLGNVALAVLLRRKAGVRSAYIPIHFRERYGGEPRVPMQAFAGKAFELLSQLREIQS